MRLRRGAFVVSTLLLVVLVALGSACTKTGETDTAKTDQTITQQDDTQADDDKSGDDGTASGSTSSAGASSGDQADGDGKTGEGAADPGPEDLETAIDEAELEDLLLLNELYFELQNMIGKKVWVIGFFGDDRFTGDGVGFLVDNMRRLLVDEELPHHSFARLDGELPPADWNGGEVLVYGEIKDFAETHGVYAVEPTPLITVIDSILVSPPSDPEGWDNPYISDPSGSLSQLLASFIGEPALWFLSDLLNPQTGTQAGDCDRSIIISGGIDASNNHSRYGDNVIAKFNKMKELGFGADQIQVFYNNGAAIEAGGVNVTDGKASKARIKAHMVKLAGEMSGSCTLTIFVTDHGTGYSAEQGYGGARPALSGTEATSGMLYDESSFKLDAKAKAYQTTDTFVYRGVTYWMAKDAAGKVELYKNVGGNSSLVGSDENGSGTITEKETGEDFNGDGDNTDNFGLSVAWMEARLNAPWRHMDNEWDTDGDGAKDVRIRWDGTRYVAERLDGGTWKEMGRDTNGDFVIDGADGGVDWNLDGDKGDKIGFHEGINLWGNEVLWDDEFSDMLKPLSEMGVHILIEMVSCFSGGFVPNLQGQVESIVTGSSEDTKHTNRYDAAGKIYAADEMAFLDSLTGIDIASWNSAWDSAVAADNKAWRDGGGQVGWNNQHTSWTKPVLTAVQSAFEAEGEGVYSVWMKLDDSLKGKVYDLEIMLGLQQPRWLWAGFPEGLPAGMSEDLIPGGIRVSSDEPFPDEFWLKIKGTEGSEKLRLQLTDKDHNAIGYVLVSAGTVPTQVQTVHVSQVVGGFQHFSGYSSVFGYVMVVDDAGLPVFGATVEIEMNGNRQWVTTDAQGKASFGFTIYQYGNYSVNVIDIEGYWPSVVMEYDPDSNDANGVIVRVQ